MKRYIKSSFNPKTEEYGGYFIDHYEYDDGTEEFVVDIDFADGSDEHFFNSESEAMEFIDDLNRIDNINRHLFYKDLGF